MQPIIQNKTFILATPRKRLNYTEQTRLGLELELAGVRADGGGVLGVWGGDVANE